MSTGGLLMGQLIDLENSLCSFMHQLHDSKCHTMLHDSLVLSVVLWIIPIRSFEAQGAVRLLHVAIRSSPSCHLHMPVSLDDIINCLFTT
jgi:uncharacterized membrane protein YqgA involved in biofilm formation